MKKLEQAIAYFEDAIKESDEIIAECSEKLQKELTEQKKHFASIEPRLFSRGYGTHDKACIYRALEIALREVLFLRPILLFIYFIYMPKTLAK